MKIKHLIERLIDHKTIRIPYIGFFDFRTWYQYKIDMDDMSRENKFNRDMAIKGWSHVWLSPYEAEVEDGIDIEEELKNKTLRKVPWYKYTIQLNSQLKTILIYTLIFFIGFIIVSWIFN
jgi:hypothetical protein